MSMSPEARVTLLRETLWTQGWRPIALTNPNDKGVSPGKRPVGLHWTDHARQTPPRWAKHRALPGSLNTGLLSDGLRVADIDVDDASLAAQCVAVAHEVLGQQAPTRFRSNSPRRLLVYRAAEGEPAKLSVKGPGGKIEVLGRGQQFVAFGEHDSGAVIQWDGEPPGILAIDDLPLVTEAQVATFLARCAVIVGANQPTDHASNEAGSPCSGAELSELVQRIAGGADSHNAAVALAGKLAYRAIPASDIRRVLRDAYERRPQADRDAAWADAIEAVPRLVRWAIGQEAKKTAALAIGEAPAASNGADASSAASGNGAAQDDPGAAAWRAQAQPQPEPEPEEEPENDWPERLTLAAFPGLIGEAVAAIRDHTEADEAALLLQLLAAFGNKIGRGPCFLVGGARHATNLFVLLAGGTSRARKGTSQTDLRPLLEADALDPWLLTCNASGLSSGEGLIYRLRDAAPPQTNKKGESLPVDPGVTDKRLFVTESEFASVLTVMRREGNTLSEVLRNAWDGKPLQTMTRNAPLLATNTLVSVAGHITVDELRSLVDRIALSNGLLNRFLFAAVKRSRLLPRGGSADQALLRQLGEQLDAAVRAAGQLQVVDMTPAADDLWRAGYQELTTDHPGLFGSLIARAEAHVVRLALIYALADQQTAIDLHHLEAALAVWRFSEDSARVLFGDMIGDPVADGIVAALKDAGGAGMSRRDLIILFNRNVDAARIQRVLVMLLHQGRARKSMRSPPGLPGRPAEIWHYVPRAKRP